jgi:hypothetical protein
MVRPHMWMSLHLPNLARYELAPRPMQLFGFRAGAGWDGQVEQRRPTWIKFLKGGQACRVTGPVAAYIGVGHQAYDGATLGLTIPDALAAQVSQWIE